MKNHLFTFLLFGMALSLCAFISPSSSPVPFQKVAGYVLVETKQPSYGNFAQLIFRDHILKQFFKQENPKEKIPAIDFENQTLICLIGGKSKTEIKYSLDKIVNENGKYLFYFVSKKGKTLKNSTSPYCLYSMKRDKSLRGIAYYLDGQLIEDVKN